MGFASHLLCSRYSRTLTPIAPAAIRVWGIQPFTYAFLLGSETDSANADQTAPKSDQDLHDLQFLLHLLCETK